MLGLQPLLRNGEHALEQRFDIGVTTLHVIDVSKLVQPLSQLRGVGAQRLFGDGDRPLVEWLGLRVMALAFLRRGQSLEPLAHLEVIHTFGFLCDGKATFIERLRFEMAALHLNDAGKLFQGDGQIGVIGTQRLLQDLKRAPVGRLGLRKATLHTENVGEPVEGLHDLGVAGSADLLLEHAERTLIEAFGFAIALLAGTEPSEVAEGPADGDMIGTQGPFLNRQGAPVERLRLGMAVAHLVDEGDVAQQFGQAGVVRSKALLGERQRLFSDCHGLVVVAGLEQLGRPTIEGVDLGLGLRGTRANSDAAANRNEEQVKGKNKASAHLGIPHASSWHPSCIKPHNGKCYATAKWQARDSRPQRISVSRKVGLQLASNAAGRGLARRGPALPSRRPGKPEGRIS